MANEALRENNDLLLTNRGQRRRTCISTKITQTHCRILELNDSEVINSSTLVILVPHSSLVMSFASTQ